MSDCVFCERISRGEFDHRGGDASMPSVTFEPLSPVVPGHLLIVPEIHVEDALERPDVTGAAMEYAAVIARLSGAKSCNLITSVGVPATQTVRHLHIHIVPRHEGDGLALPWTGQRAMAGASDR
jgi:histidine triad (HIT) family protein